MPKICRKCDRALAATFIYCPWCGKLYRPINNTPNAKYKRKWRENGQKPLNTYFAVEDVMRYLQPIIDLNGNAWLSRKLEIDESRIRIVKKQKTIREQVVDEWFTKLGIQHAYEELKPVQYALREPPQSQYYEE